MGIESKERSDRHKGALELGRGVAGGEGGQAPAAGTASHLEDLLEPTVYVFTGRFQLVPGLKRFTPVVHKLPPAVLKL